MGAGHVLARVANGPDRLVGLTTSLRWMEAERGFLPFVGLGFRVVSVVRGRNGIELDLSAGLVGCETTGGYGPPVR